MIKITIDADNAFDARRDLLTLAGMMGDTATVSTEETVAAPKPARQQRKAATTPSAAAVSDDAAPSLTATDDVDRELLAPVEPAPNTAATLVDAGTGQPAAAAAAAEPVKQMTMDDVRASAAKLAAADQDKLVELLKKYGAGKLSDVPGDKLGDFAGDVLAALGDNA